MTTIVRIAVSGITALSVVVLTQPARAQSTSRGGRGYVSVNALYDVASRTDTTVAGQTINQEPARITTTHEAGSQVLFDVSAGGRIQGNLGLGFAGTYGTADRDVRITGDIPHPFFFSRPRALSGTGMLRRTDLAVHVSARWMVPLSRRFEVAIFGGPTWFRVDQQVIESLTPEDVYPFDAVSLGGYTAASKRGSRVGAHGGIDASYFFSRRVGLHALLRYSDATVPLPGDVGSVKAGGLHLGGGLRIRY
ncbi:MAG: hypothetical protein AB7O32_19915 [Vicinamibacterales bacterium]